MQCSAAGARAGTLEPRHVEAGDEDVNTGLKMPLYPAPVKSASRHFATAQSYPRWLSPADHRTGANRQNGIPAITPFMLRRNWRTILGCLYLALRALRGGGSSPRSASGFGASSARATRWFDDRSRLAGSASTSARDAVGRNWDSREEVSRDAEYRDLSSRGSTEAVSGLGPGNPAVPRADDVVEDPRTSGAAGIRRTCAHRRQAGRRRPAAGHVGALLELTQSRPPSPRPPPTQSASATALASTALGTQRPSSLCNCPVGQPVPQALPS